LKKEITLHMLLRKLVLASSVLCAISYAQPILTLSPTTFHVQGKIVDSHNSAIVGAEVKFESRKTTEAVSEAVSSDSRGFYHAELPLGLYSMTVAKGSSGYGEHYRRPPFRVSSPKTIVLNVTLYPPLPSCDPGSITVTRPDGTPETETAGAPKDLRDECAGWDRLPVPSNEDVSFELLVRYSSRLRRDGERIYNSGFLSPVVVAFNLFTLTADHVTYDLASRTLLATGNVTTTNGSAGSTHANSMKFRIVNDSVLRLRYGKMQSPK
jgi:Carboxypeptidase regulatory-like domain